MGHRAEGSNRDEGDQPVGQLLGCGRRGCAPGRTRRRDRLGALGTMFGGGSLQLGPPARQTMITARGGLPVAPA